MALSFPAIFMGVSEDACLTRCRSESKRSSLAAAMDVEVLPLYAHATADVLSQNMPTCLKVRSGTTCSKTNQPSTRPASSRSLMVSLPCGFVAETSSCWMSRGHSYCHTQKGVASIPGVITPPAPNLHASVYCT